MRQRLLTTLATLGLAAGLAGPSEAEPINARLSLQVLPVGISTAITGAELETRLGTTPLTLGGQTGYITDGSHAQGTLWLSYGHSISPDLQVGGLIGLNQTWDRRRIPAEDGATQDRTVYSGPIGYLVGVSARKEWGCFWAQATPNYVLIPEFLSYLTLREAVISGLPWLEVGYRITPSFEMSLRSTITPITASLIY